MNNAKKGGILTNLLTVIIIAGLVIVATAIVSVNDEINYRKKLPPLRTSSGIRPSEIVSFKDSELTDIERKFFSELNEGELKEFNLYDAFLIASGIKSPEEFLSYRKKLYKIRSNALSAMFWDNWLSYLNRNPSLVAKKLLFWLHKNPLKEYGLKATTARDILDVGKFNCLSSSVLYAIIARDLNLNVKGVLAPEHVFCLLVDKRKDKDIETTVRYGFDPGEKEIERMKNEVRYIYVPKKNYRERKEIGVLELIGMLYANRLGFSQTPQEKLAGAKELPSYKKGYYFNQESDIFRKNMASCFNNLAIKAMDEKKFELALSYINEGEKIAPQEKCWKELTLGYYNRRALEAKDKNGYGAAIAIAKKGLSEDPKDKILKENLAFFYNEWANEYLRSNDYREALNTYKLGLADSPDNRLLLDNMKISYYNIALKEFNARNYESAIELCREGLQSQGGYSSSDGMLRGLVKNSQEAIKLEYYNKAVGEFNAANYKKAIRTCEEGLSHGESVQVDNNLKTLKKSAESRF